MTTSERTTTSDVTVIGIGNILLGDEGVGVHAVRQLMESGSVPDSVQCIDGGTGSMTLLEPMQDARRLILIDATADGAPVGTVRRLRPRFSSDYPRTLTAHDIGLKDLLDSFYLLGSEPDVTLFAVSISDFNEMSVELSPQVAAALPEVVKAVIGEIESAC